MFPKGPLKPIPGAPSGQPFSALLAVPVHISAERRHRWCQGLHVNLDVHRNVVADGTSTVVEFIAGARSGHQPSIPGSMSPAVHPRRALPQRSETEPTLMGVR